jgi:glycosyltransferase involved in cell wall biosynthesis
VANLVTIGLPLYRRFDYLPAALAAVAAQDYSDIELLVSDNGENPETIRELVAQHYPKPFRFRRNPVTVPAAVHYNQLIAEAAGEYFVLLCDDDEISPNFVTALVPLLRDHPDTAIALARQEIIDGKGAILRQSSEDLPTSMTGLDFLRAWCRHEHRIECWATNLARTADLRRSGGFLATPLSTHSDDGLLVKLAAGGGVRFAPGATFRWRIDGESHGWTISVEGLAADTRSFLTFLAEDAYLEQTIKVHGEAWHDVRRELERMAWGTYWHRWNTMYRARLPFGRWALAAFAMPPILSYYRHALGSLRQATAERIWQQFIREGPKSLPDGRL